MHMPESPHVCELLTLIRAVEGLTPRGRPPLHSRDGHSQPVNSPHCKRHRQRAAECGTHTKETKATQWLQIPGMQAHTKRQTHIYTSLSSSLLPSSLPAAGQQLACPIVSHTDETAQLCPNSVLPPFRAPINSQFSVWVNSKGFTAIWAHKNKYRQWHKENKSFPSLYTDKWKLKAHQSNFIITVSYCVASLFKSVQYF